MTGIVALYIFMLAAFTGYEVISRVPVILHTPLMSGSNFIHGIVLVGAMVALGGAQTPLEKGIGILGVLLAAGNAVGGYVVTERMLEMFKTSGRAAQERRAIGQEPLAGSAATDVQDRARAAADKRTS
jgi:NAD(P) transhydrogenase subunit alpha